jgi:hypothetical protein
MVGPNEVYLAQETPMVFKQGREEAFFLTHRMARSAKDARIVSPKSHLLREEDILSWLFCFVGPQVRAQIFT